MLGLLSSAFTADSDTSSDDRIDKKNMALPKRMNLPVQEGPSDAMAFAKTVLAQYPSNTDQKKYRREAEKRVFVNRSLQIEKIKFFGFDMDYTLAVYKSPELEVLGFDLILRRLISKGYPPELKDIYQYDHTIPIRGLWFDMEYGNLLKVDAYGNILVGMHGLEFLSVQDIDRMYPNKFIPFSESRVYILNTLFNLPECYILAIVVDYFSKSSEAKKLVNKTGVKWRNVTITYRSVFEDVRSSVDYVHWEGGMKKRTLDALDKYVLKDDRIGEMLDRIRKLGGAKTFLLTNSDYEYTNKIMGFLLNYGGRNWRSFFDYVVVDARKPKWFAEGTVFREIDPLTGECKLGSYEGPLSSDHVYSGGSCDQFSRLAGANGKDTLYIGDHIFGDVLRSKKSRGWRTFLVVPELIRELQVWTEKREIFETLQKLDVVTGSVYKNLDSASTKRPDIKQLSQAYKLLVHEMDQSYGMLGSLFRSGSRLTFFASQVQRYADLYANSPCNLLYYPFCYFFRSPPMLIPHESTVDDKVIFSHEPFGLGRTRAINDNPMVTPLTHSSPKNVETKSTAGRFGRATTPRQSTFVFDDEGGDEATSSDELDKSNGSTNSSHNRRPSENETDDEGKDKPRTRTDAKGNETNAYADIVGVPPEYVDPES